MARRSYTDPEEPSLAELFSETTAKLQLLMRKELELAKLEMKEQAAAATKAGALFGFAAVGGLVAFVMLAGAAAWGLAEVMPTGLAFLIVAVVFGAVAGILALQGKKKLASFNPVPERTVETVKEDVQTAKDALQRGAQGPPQEQQLQQNDSDAWRRY